MPGKKGGGFLCGCLGGSDPTPEISYEVRDQNGGMTLKPIEVDVPMPNDEAELDAKFAELVDELGLDKSHRDAMFSLPAEKKWQIYCSKKKEHEGPKSSNWPDFYIDSVKEMTALSYINDENEIESRTQLMDNLKTALRTQPMSFVLRYLELGGLDGLLDFLRSMNDISARSSVHTSLLGCLKALMNSSEGRSHVLAHPNGVNIIAQSLAADNARTKVATLEILGAMCLVPGGHKKVLQAMVHFQKYAGERTRFQSLIYYLGCMSGEYRDDVILKTAIMSFINAALRYGPGQTHLEFRLHLRYEFLMLGIQPIIDKLRDHSNTTLDRHLDFFEIVRMEDERQLAKKFEVNHVDTKSASAMFELLKKKLSCSFAYSHLLSVLFHLLQLPFGSQQVCVQYWQLVDKIVQQVALQTKDGNPDVAPVDIDMLKLIKQLASESTMKEFHQKIREAQKDNDELATRLAKKERECEVKVEEKEELMQTLNNIRSRLEKEISAHAETRAQLDEMTTRLYQLQQLVNLERNERAKLELAVTAGGLTDDGKVGLSTSALIGSLVGPGSLVPLPSPAPPPPPPPPPPPSAGFIPPPPPLLGAPGMGSAAGFTVKKNVPQSKQPMKSFNWSKIPENAVKNTIWQEIDDTKVYRSLDLEDFEHQFSAYQRQEGSDDNINGRISTAVMKTRELSVIDGRRAQNCTILLSKLKMTNQELARAILGVDSQEEIPRDMCEQLLKFVPTVEEVQMLTEHEHEIEHMARADRFLFEMSRIDHYEQRLRALYYKKKFHERMSDVKFKVEAVLHASRDLTKSRHLKRLLELVLAFGNFMNRGQRGNAYGFHVSSLNKIVDTKSSINRRLTLLHYLADILEQKFPELLKLENEIQRVRDAAKVNMGELEADLNVLRVGLRDIEKEVEYHRTHIPGARRQQDKFVTVMGDFVSVSAFNFSELEDKHREMKKTLEMTLELFGEDSKKMQPDEFFGIFEIFLATFSEARQDNERFRRLKEEEEKRQKMETQLKAERENRERTRQGSKCENKGEFDDLISALRTGEVFGEDIAKLKRTRRRPSAQKEMSAEVLRERIGSIQAY